MTREEAIKWFKDNPFYNKDHEPFNMAIKALKQEPLEVEAAKLQEAYNKGFADCRHAIKKLLLEIL